MRKLLRILTLVVILSVPVSAVEYTAPQAPPEVSDLMPVETESFSDGLLKIIKNAISDFRPQIAGCIKTCLSVLTVVMVMAVLVQMPSGTKMTVEFAGCLAVALILMDGAHSMIRLGAQTVTTLSEYGKLLLPVMTGAMAAQGGTVSSAALYTGTAAFDAVLSSAISNLLVPMVYMFLVLSIAAATTGQSMLNKLRELIKGLMSWGLKTVLYIFTGYISITGVISGTTDAAALKATKLTVSGMVPMVGGILSDASEAVIVGAGLMKNAVGIYGVLAIFAIWISPFMQLGLQYLLLKLTAAVCEVFEIKPVTELIRSFSAAMGLLLGMTGSVCFLLLVSMVCFMRGVG